MKYDVNYFIKKFEAIPEDNWATGTFESVDGKHCANGFCGVREGCIFPEEAKALNVLFEQHGYLNYSYRLSDWGAVACVNDGYRDYYLKPTPKQRILAALYDIKKMTIEQKPELSVATKMPIEQYPDITKTLAILPEDKKEVDLLIAEQVSD